MSPRELPCQPYVYDSSVVGDEYHSNRPLTATFEGLTSWKNGRNGAIALKVGDVRMKNFKLVDNILAGAEYEHTDDLVGINARVQDSWIIARSHGNNFDFGALNMNDASPIGVWGPKSEGFGVFDTKFYGFNYNDAAALSDCSHCWHDATTDSGARTYHAKGLSFIDTTKYIHHGLPYTGIWFDVDGSLTGKGPASWATFYYPHLMQEGCTRNENTLDGIACDNQVTIKRLSFTAPVPKDVLRGMPLRILPYNTERAYDLTEDDEGYVADSEYSQVNFKAKKRPMHAWTVGFIPKQTYKIHWGTGVNFEGMEIEVSELWQPNDGSIHFVHNFTDQREAFNFYDTGDKFYRAHPIATADLEPIEAKAMKSNPLAHETNMQQLFNDTREHDKPHNEFHFILASRESNGW